MLLPSGASGNADDGDVLPRSNLPGILDGQEGRLHAHLPELHRAVAGAIDKAAGILRQADALHVCCRDGELGDSLQPVGIGCRDLRRAHASLLAWVWRCRWASQVGVKVGVAVLVGTGVRVAGHG